MANSRECTYVCQNPANVEATTSSHKAISPRFIIEIPNDVDAQVDGFLWRKYGQKKVFASCHNGARATRLLMRDRQVKQNSNPRSYFKCTAPRCNVKKQVEQCLESDKRICIYDNRHSHDVRAPGSSKIHDVVLLAEQYVRSTSTSSLVSSSSAPSVVGVKRSSSTASLSRSAVGATPPRHLHSFACQSANSRVALQYSPAKKRRISDDDDDDDNDNDNDNDSETDDDDQDDGSSGAEFAGLYADTASILFSRAAAMQPTFVQSTTTATTSTTSTTSSMMPMRHRPPVRPSLIFEPPASISLTINRQGSLHSNESDSSEQQPIADSRW